MKLIHEGKKRLWIVAENETEAQQIGRFVAEWAGWMGYSPDGYGKYGAVGYDVIFPKLTNKEEEKCQIES